MSFDIIIKTLFALVRAGLWEHVDSSSKFQDSSHETCNLKLETLDRAIDWEEVYRLATEQSILGLVLAGIAFLPEDQRPPKIRLLQWIGEIQILEQQNQAMNSFIRELVEDLRKEEIYALLVKGQGIAQCYERPMWRASGDVDLLLNEDNYEKAKVFMAKIASSVEPERVIAKHIGYTVDSWTVELHAPAPESLKKPIYKVMKDVWRSIFNMGNVRVWDNDGVSVFIPSPDNDIIIVFTHLFGHFCFGGIGLKQLCDLCRLLWVYRKKIDHKLLENRLKKMGLMTEWKVFASLMVNWLGMPKEALPFYSDSACYKRKASRACARILRSGNLGVNVDDSYRSRQPQWKANLITFWRRTGEFFGLLSLFPLDAPRFFWNYLAQKVKK